MKFSKFGFILIVVGIFLLLSTYNIFFFTFSRDWPWILIIIGLLNLISFEKKRNIKIHINSGKRKKILEDLKDGKISVEEAIEELEEE
jgi:predicted membrane protein